MLKKLFQRRETLPNEVRQGAFAAAECLFASMFGEKPPATAANGHPESPHGVVSVISFDGDVAYSFALILPETTAPQLAKDFAGMEIDFHDPNMLFVVAELANLIAGDLVARMEANRINTKMSLPSLSRGPEILHSLSMGREMVDMIFTLPQGDVVCKLASGPKFELVQWPGQ